MDFNHLLLQICEQVEEVETVYSEPESPLLSPNPPISLENQPHKVSSKWTMDLDWAEDWEVKIRTDGPINGQGNSMRRMDTGQVELV